MNSYHLLAQALEPRDASSPRLFSYAVMSAVNGFVPHEDYVRLAAGAERTPPSDRALEEQVGLLLACDANPLSELVQCASDAAQFAERWNGINRKVALGVATLVEGPDLNRQPQMGHDSPLRQRVMQAFVEQLKPGSHSPGLGRGERRLEVVARHVGAGSAMIELTEALYEMPGAELGDCAGALGCSIRTLQRQLTRSAVTFGQVKQAVRICMSAALLRDSGAPLTEVALAAGFYDSAHFSRAMKVASGLSPSEYRLLSAA